MNQKQYMRINLIAFLITLCSLHLTGAVRSQSVTIDAKRIELKEIFRQIEQQTGYIVFAKESLFKKKIVDVKAEKMPIGNFLDLVLKNQGIDYHLLDKSIVLSAVKSKVEVTGGGYGDNNLLIQEHVIYGRITDEKGNPLEGVTVKVKGSTTHTTSGADGSYRINAGAIGARLVFSNMGFQSVETAVTDSNRLDVSMSLFVSDLDEVVVIGYGTVKKANLSGAVETVSANKLVSRSTPNIGVALQGLVPNLNISHPGGGATNTTPTFNIRGMTSINGGSPLILVDGVPTTAADFSRMNPLDIESFTMLKDASSAAIYGARAAYGVILVTTKTGTTDKLAINVNSSYNIRKNGRMPKAVLDPYIQSSYKKIMGQPWYNLYTDEEIAYAKERVADPSLPAVIPSSIDPNRWTYLGATDWYSEIFNDLETSDRHSLSLSGMTPKTSYFLGLENSNERGMLKWDTDIFRKYNLRTRLDFRPTNWLTLGTNLSLLMSNLNRPTNYASSVFGGTHHTTSSLLPIKNPDGTWATNRLGTSLQGNIFAILQEGGDYRSDRYALQGQFSAKVDLIKDVWSIKTDYTRRSIDLKETTWDSDLNIPYRDGPDLPVFYRGSGSYAQVSNANTTYNLLNLYSNFEKNFGDHFLSALVGFSREDERYEYSNAHRRDLITSSYPTVQLATGLATVGENMYDWAIMSGFFRLNYVFKDRYIVEVNSRYDGSSRFPRKDRFGVFPSISGAWVASQESFFESVPVVSYLKVRGSYGSLGNQDVSHYQYIANMSASLVNVLVNGARPMGVYTPGLVSNSLTWERVYSANIGLDMKLFTDKLSLSADLYNRQTKDMLTKGKTLPIVLGAVEPRVNAADLKTKGWEVSVGYRDRLATRSDDISFGARFVLSDNRAFITRFDNPTGILSDYYVGQEVGQIWGLTTLGFFADENDIKNHADQWEVTAYPGNRSIEPGDLKYKDVNGDGKVNRGAGTLDNPGDFTVIGNSTDRYSFGLDMDVEWKGFDVRVLLQGVGKKDFYPSSAYTFFGIFSAPWGNVLEHNMDHWTPENPNGYFPRLKSYLANGAGDMSYPQTRYLQDASYLRVKNVTLGYTLPNSLVRHIAMGNVRFFASGENVWEFTKLTKAFDPEALVENAHPFQRVFAFGVSASF